MVTARLTRCRRLDLPLALSNTTRTKGVSIFGNGAAGGARGGLQKNVRHERVQAKRNTVANGRGGRLAGGLGMTSLRGRLDEILGQARTAAGSGRGAQQAAWAARAGGGGGRLSVRRGARLPLLLLLVQHVVAKLHEGARLASQLLHRFQAPFGVFKDL